MTQRLTIGLVENDAGWRTLLRQVGVAFERVEWNRVDAAHYSTIIVNRSLSRVEGDLVDEYLRAGGAVLDGGGLATHDGLETKRLHVGSIVDASPPFERTWIVDVDDGISRVAAAGALGATVALMEHGGGWLAHVPFDIAAVFRDSRAARRRFHAPSGDHPNEVVARTPKHPFRIVVESALSWLHARRGLPLAHFWCFPDDARSVFAYRIDTDYGTPAHMLRLRDLAERHGVPLTIFLHVGAHEEHLRLFDGFERHELASHGYRHRTFSSYEANWGNIAEARHVMSAAGFDAAGFAAPTGRWNRGLDRALQEHGFEYSSEFTLDYDGLPFRPWIGAGLSSVLQVPVHPVSVGNLTRVHATELAITDYYRSVIDRQLAQRSPVFLYHHPLQEAWQVLESIFERVRAEGLPAVTMREFASWWRRRDDARFRASITEGRLELAVPIAAERLQVRLVDPSGREHFLAAEGSYDLQALQWQTPRTTVLTPPPDLAAIRRPTLTMLRHSLEDAISRFRQ